METDYIIHQNAIKIFKTPVVSALQFSENWRKMVHFKTHIYILPLETTTVYPRNCIICDTQYTYNQTCPQRSNKITGKIDR